jgi:hypothetical protein
MYLLKRIKIFKSWVNFTDCLWLNMMRALLQTARYFKYLSTRKIYLQKKIIRYSHLIDEAYSFGKRNGRGHVWKLMGHDNCLLLTYRNYR